MGHVYLAHDPHLDRDVAIKVLPREFAADEERVNRFLREARLAAKIQHPNTVIIHQVAVEDGLASIVMELLDGGSLEEIIAERGPMPWREATRAIRDAAAGLAAAHEIGLVHRDVKPANLMRTGKGVTKVVDFGLVRATEGNSQLTQQGMILGTPAYMAPEQWMGKEADARADLYSLVCTYYYLLTGQPPYEAPSTPSLGYQHRYEPFPDPRKLVPDLPQAVCRVLARGAEKDPADRYQTAAELIAALDELSARSDELLAYEDILEAAANPPVKPHTAGSDNSPKRKHETQPDPSRALRASVDRPITNRVPDCPILAKRTGRPAQDARGQRIAEIWDRCKAAIPPRFRTPGGLAIGAGGLGAFLLLLAVIIYVATDSGTIKIEISDPTADVQVKLDGQTIEIAGLKDPLKVKAGRHELLVTSGEFQTVTQSFTVRRGDNPVLHVALERKRAAPAQVAATANNAAVPLEKPSAAQADSHPSVREEKPPAAPEQKKSAPTQAVGGPTPDNRPRETTIDLGKGVKLELVLIPAGEFLMGWPDSDNNASGHGHDEEPQHRVRITQPFYLGKYLVTQEQWEAVMGSNPSQFKGPKNPTEVSWEDCRGFVEKLNANMSGGKFLLPSEAQWEYACRAGSTTRYYFGDEKSGLTEYAWYDANSDHRTHPVGEKKPNGWGLYDMGGNVWEWCQDWYEGGYYANSPTDDPTGPVTGSERVDRGGSWGTSGELCRSANRDRETPTARNGIHGFRIARVAAESGDAPRLAQPLKLQSIATQSVELGKRLNVMVTPENADVWKGKVRYSLGPQAPRGASIDPQSGEFSWTPPADQAAGKYDVTVSAQGPDGQTALMTLVVTLTKPTPDPAKLPAKEIAADLGDGVKLELVLIPAGEFLMGSPDSDKDASPNEKPQHRVRITKPFYLGKYLVTQEQWEAVMSYNPSQFKGPKNPVERVSWEDCRGFVEKLNAKVGGGKFSLPTEAQWEYACRAGSTTRYCYGDDETQLGEYAWYEENSDRKTHPVGEKTPNAGGLYDMHGNVWEWCQDWYDQGYYANSPTDDPTGPAGGSIRVNRGGSWSLTARNCRSAIRFRFSPGHRVIILGFRVSRVPAEAGSVPRLAEPHDGATPTEPSSSTQQTAPDDEESQDKPVIGENRPTPAKHMPPANSDLGLIPKPGPEQLVQPPADQKPHEEAAKFGSDPSLAIAPFGAARAKQHQEAWAKHLGVSVTMTNRIGMKFMLIPPGEFLMGSGESAQETAKFFQTYGKNAAVWFEQEHPQHRVRITRAFWLGKYHVTVGEFRRFVNATRYVTDAEKEDKGTRANTKRSDNQPTHAWHSPSFAQTDAHPVVDVSWNDAAEFCRWLSRKERREYRLPTEAEWEYACRAGTTTRYYNGDDPEALVQVANVADATAKGRFPTYCINATDGFAFTAPVGLFQPNAFRLYDMHGNACQWCADWYGGYANSPVDDPTGPKNGDHRVQRGGSYFSRPDADRSAYRVGFTPDYHTPDGGFRVALVAADK
jgi:formylglycine-generating enzyme required for sulfatase activity